MEIMWEVSDGYVGGSRPQYTEIDDGDILECDSVDEAMDMVQEYLQEDFEQNISWSMDDFEEVKKQVKKMFEDAKEE